MKLKRGVSSSSINRLVYGYGARWADDDFQKCSISDRGTGEREGGVVQRINNYTEQNVLPANQPSSFQSITFISGLNSTGVPGSRCGFEGRRLSAFESDHSKWGLCLQSASSNLASYVNDRIENRVARSFDPINFEFCREPTLFNSRRVSHSNVSTSIHSSIIIPCFLACFPSFSLNFIK